ncbi:MAG: hypothetical protein H6Q90_1974 [Deltaproteobacteria bacterium]|nr:hypothetical protein [Deltaproteobacteria bacterium]
MRLSLALPFVLATLTACGGGPKAAPTMPAAKPDPIPHTAGPACTAVAEHLVIVLAVDEPDTQAKLGDMVRTRCTTDQWSDEARSCLAAAENGAEVKGCVGTLTEPQRTAFDADERALLGKTDAPKAETAPAPTAAPPPPARATRGATPKPKGGSKTSDPCQGGE